MIADPQGAVLALFAAFCRIGSCFMLLPGLGTARISPRIRLFVAIAVSLAVLPLVWDSIYPEVEVQSSTYVAIIGGEVIIGAVIGLLARFYVLALQFAATAISMLIGFNSMSTSDLVEQTPQTELANIINFSGLLLLFILNFHHMIIAALARSYDLIPVGREFDPQMALAMLTDALSKSFMIVLQLASPFVIYGLVFNVAVGLVNKLAPQIPIYFISIPFIIAGGLVLLYFGSQDMLHLFAVQFETVFEGR